MRMMWTIQVEMRYQGYDLHDLVAKTLYLYNYTTDQDSYLP